jgi:hypothetical protein
VQTLGVRLNLDLMLPQFLRVNLGYLSLDPFLEEELPTDIYHDEYDHARNYVSKPVCKLNLVVEEVPGMEVRVHLEFDSKPPVKTKRDESGSLPDGPVSRKGDDCARYEQHDDETGESEREKQRESSACSRGWLGCNGHVKPFF